MKITITPTGGAAFTLADDSVNTIVSTSWPMGATGQIKESFLNKQKRTSQKSPLFRSAYLLNIPRFNLLNQINFTVQRSFQTVENCISFIAFHPDSVPVQGEITIQEQSTTGMIARYLPNAVVDSVECTMHSGCACNFQYAISGNGAWQTSP
jgi:hypothetical protein